VKAGQEADEDTREENGSEGQTFEAELKRLGVRAWVYVWTDPLGKLEARPWR
jgi:hypothetical protein